MAGLSGYGGRLSAAQAAGNTGLSGLRQQNPKTPGSVLDPATQRWKQPTGTTGFAGAQQSGRYGGGYGGNYNYYFPQGDASAYYSSLYPQGNVSAVPSAYQPTYPYNPPEINRAIYAGLEGSQASPYNAPVTMGQNNINTLEDLYAQNAAADRAFRQQSLVARRGRMSTLQAARRRRGQQRNASWYRDIVGGIGARFY